MIIQPAPATQELADDIDIYFARGRQLSDLDLRRLEKKADSLKGKVDNSEYYAFLGIIAALRRDEENVTRHFENALKLAPSDTEILSNYIIALSNSGGYLQALAVGKNLVKKLNNNRDLLKKIIGFAFGLGRFHEALTLLNQLEKPQQCEWYQGIIDATKLVDDAQLDDDEVMHLQQLAFSVIPKMNLYFSGATLNIAHNCIHYEIFVDLPIEGIFDVNWELTETLVENTHNQYNDVLMFEYSSVDVSDERRAS